MVLPGVPWRGKTGCAGNCVIVGPNCLLRVAPGEPVFPLRGRSFAGLPALLLGMLESCLAWVGCEGWKCEGIPGTAGTD